MNEEIFMEVPEVRRFAARFRDISNTLQTVSKTLEALLQALKATVILGPVGAAAYVQFTVFKQHIDKLANTCAEISGDLGESADAYEAGDMAGANLFATKFG